MLQLVDRYRSFSQFLEKDGLLCFQDKGFLRHVQDYITEQTKGLESKVESVPPQLLVNDLSFENFSPLAFTSFYDTLNTFVKERGPGTLTPLDKTLTELQLASLESQISREGSNPVLLLRRAEGELRIGRFMEAFNHARDVSFGDPQYAVDAYNLQGLARDYLRDYDTALHFFQKAIELEPHGAALHHNKSLALFGLKQYDLALESSNRAIELDPHISRAYIQRAAVKEVLGKNLQLLMEAVEDIEKAKTLAPYSVAPYDGGGYIKHQMGLFSQSVEDFDQAIEFSPCSEVFYHNRGCAKIELGQFEDALKDFDQALALGGDSFIYIMRGYAKIKLGLLKEGIQDLDASILMNDSNSRSFCYRAEAYEKLLKQSSFWGRFFLKFHIKEDFSHAFFILQDIEEERGLSRTNYAYAIRTALALTRLGHCTFEEKAKNYEVLARDKGFSFSPSELGLE